MYEKLCDCLRDDGIFISTLGGAVYYDEAEKLLIDFAKGLESTVVGIIDDENYKIFRQGSLEIET